jgi:F-type H+-transporting ATPase subunit epsilon
MSNISFDLVSPEKLLFSNEVGMIIIPGKDGDIGVLPGHSKVLSSLRPGRIMIFGEDKHLLKSFFVTDGFVEINPEKCIVLAEEVNEMNDLDKNTLQKKIQVLENSKDDMAKDELKIVHLKLEALNSTYYEKL